MMEHNIIRLAEIKISESARILIVEDDSDQPRLLVKIVKEPFDCEILEAEDGLEALNIILQDKHRWRCGQESQKSKSVFEPLLALCGGLEQFEGRREVPNRFIIG